MCQSCEEEITVWDITRQVIFFIVMVKVYGKLLESILIVDFTLVFNNVFYPNIIW